MEYQEIVRGVVYLCTVVFGGLALWYQGSSKLNGRVTAFIRQAEERYRDVAKAGGVKFDWVVQQLYGLIPAAARPFVPRSLVEQIVQTAFDAIEGYAKTQLDKLAGKAGARNG